MRLAPDVAALRLHMMGAMVGLGKLATPRTLREATRAAGPASDAAVMPLRRRTRCSPSPSGSTPLRSSGRGPQEWLVNTAVEVRVDRGSDTEALAPLLRRRAELLDGLVAELTPRPFGPRHFDGLDTPSDWEEAEYEQLGPFEAILLDRALAREPGVLVIPNELKLRLACEARERRQRFARAGVAATALVTALTLTISVVADAPARLAIGVVIAVPALGIGLSLLAFVRNSETSWPLEPLILGLLCETGLGVFLIVEGTRKKALVGDEVATVIGIATVGIPLILKAVVGRVQKL
jgi:hypothetical protein